MTDEGTALLRVLHDEHGDALFAHALRLAGGRPSARRRSLSGDVASCVATSGGAGPTAGFGTGVAVHDRTEPGNRRVATAFRTTR